MADWESAFGELLVARGSALRSYAYLLTGDPAAASDLVQDALLRVFSRLRVGTDVVQLEIADQLGCAEGTVKRHLADARAKLAAQLGTTEESMR
ncbi:sigma factor-like helix-turn-helix DNA-binding protein [Kribbella catacumbae]|uniref:sigma factor-like helix-turn-helix DNA-binding protein n=1 Tax=Kribbella catacumbae TaxID=460086 RepID=UPI000364212C|nr:sigma factor-like helix-turn-helix DNA-binding protein [Kribbella catacumbae]